MVTIWMAVKLYDDTCFGDQLSFFADSKMGEGLTLSNLFEFFNEHQMVFTRLTVYADYVWLHGSNVLSYVVNSLLLLGVWAVYGIVFKRSSGELTRRQLLVCCGVFLTLYFNGQMLLNLTFPIMEFPWTSFLAVCGFFLFSQLPFAFASAGAERRLGPVVLLFATLVAAALSCAGGLLAGPAMLVMLAILLLWSTAFPRSVLWRLGLILSGMSGIIIVLYVGAYLAVSGGHHERPGFDLMAIGRFVYTFVGGPFFNDTEWPIVYHSSLLALYSVPALFWGVLAWLAVQLYRRRNQVTAFELFHWCVIVFVLLTAVSGSLFRAQLGSLEGFSKKYVAIALLAWLSAASLLLGYWPGLFFGYRRSWVRPLAICSAAVLLLLPGSLVQFRMWRVWKAEIRETVSAVASGVYSTDLLRRLYYQGPAGYAASQVFVREGKYCYRRMPAPGYRLQERFHTAASSRSDVLAAHITPVHDDPERAGFLATGTTANRNAGLPALVITDGDDRVLGYGTVAGLPLENESTPEDRQWFAAFQRPPEFKEAGTVRVYSVQGELATLSGTLSVTADREIDFETRASSRPVARVADNTDYSLDIFNGVQAPLEHQPIHVSLQSNVDLVGWAVDRDRSTLPPAVDVVIDGEAYAARRGSQREDVANYFHKPGFAWSGYTFAMPAAKLGAGPHQLRIRIYTDGARFHLDSAVYAFTVE